MVAAGLLALALLAAPRPQADELAALRKSVPAELKGPLAPLAAPFQSTRKGSQPTVANVRARLKAVRALEQAARPLLASGKQPAVIQRALALAWAELGDLESALVIEGEGEGPERDLVRAMAQARSEDAYAISADALAHDAPAPIAQLARSRRIALDACWQEHLLSLAGPDTLETLATLSLENGRVTAVEFNPRLQGTRAHLGECLTTRLLTWRTSDDADAAELPLHFAPARESAPGPRR